jgi:hypothetical protein
MANHRTFERSEMLQLYERWCGEAERKALELGRDADGDGRGLALTAFLLAVMLARPERRPT